MSANSERVPAVHMRSEPVTSQTPPETPPVPDPTDRPRSLARSLVKLARPVQWSKSAFVLVGPFYGWADAVAHHGEADTARIALWAFAAAASFALASSGCYVVNDLADAEADRAHPRKKKRPIASGAVSPGLAKLYALALIASSLALLMLIPDPARWWTLLAIALYVVNVTAYSRWLKHLIIADVMSLSIGFVLRVMAGCAAVAIEPSTWLLNVVLFLSMFLAFGKRLGERRTLATSLDGGSGAALHRRVQQQYTETILQMSVVVTAVATLMTYALYVQAMGDEFVSGFNLLWLSVLPASYGLLRCIVLLEAGRFDDPTELAIHDRPFQVSGILFVIVTVGAPIVAQAIAPASGG